MGVSTGRTCMNNMAQGGDAKQPGKSLSAEIRGAGTLYNIKSLVGY